MLQNMILARLDGSEIRMLIPLILVFALLIFVSTIRPILMRRKQAAVDKAFLVALLEKRFPDAAALFLRVARAEFHCIRGKRAATFERALAGLERVFLAAGRPVDFARLRGLRADLATLRADKKYRSVDVLRDYLTADGWKIRTRIDTEAIAFFDNLPTLKG